jgi:hypothetical protein
MTWSAERVEFIKAKFLGENLSASRIANLLGDKSRSAVAGKLNRLGIRRPYSPVVRTLKAPKGTSRRQQAKSKPVQVIVSEPAAALSIPFGEPFPPIPLIQAGACQCRWITGKLKDHWHVCGRETRGGPFCSGHSAIVYQPRPARRNSRAE